MSLYCAFLHLVDPCERHELPAVVSYKQIFTGDARDHELENKLSNRVVFQTL